MVLNKMDKIEDICEEEKVMMITKLIGLGETQREIYDRLQTDMVNDNKLKKAYELHQEELELLIKYQSEVIR